MTRVFVGIGSNINSLENIGRALHALRTDFQSMVYSEGYENPSDGFLGHHFINIVVLFDTNLSLPETLKKLHQIELDLEKDLSAPKYAEKTIDMDLLFFGDLQLSNDRITIPRPEATSKSYYLKPLFDIAPDWIDPVTRTSITDLWNGFTGLQELKAVAIKEVPLSTSQSVLTVDSLTCALHLGVPKEERVDRQPVLISWKITFARPPQATASDDIRDTSDYSVVSETLKRHIEDQEFQTIEYLAAYAFDHIANHLEAGTRLSVCIRKFPPVDGLQEGVSFTLEGQV